MPVYRGTHYPLLTPRVLRPNEVSKLAVWLRADAIQGLADGDPVGTWPDSSGLARDATQSTAAQKPTYRASRAAFSGKPVLEFDTVDDCIASAFGATLSQPNTFFVVAKVGATGAQRFMIDGDGVGGRHAIFQESVTRWQYYAGSLVDDGASDTSVHIFQATFNGASSVLRVDGASGTTGNTGADSIIGVILGAQQVGTSNFGGDIAEVMVYNAALSLDQINGLGLYLAAKYGVFWKVAG